MEEDKESLDQGKNNGTSEPSEVLRSEFLNVASKLLPEVKFIPSDEDCFDLTIPAKSQEFGPLFISFDERITVFLGTSGYHEHFGQDYVSWAASYIQDVLDDKVVLRQGLMITSTYTRSEKKVPWRKHLFGWGLAHPDVTWSGRIGSRASAFGGFTKHFIFLILLIFALMRSCS